MAVVDAQALVVEAVVVVVDEVDTAVEVVAVDAAVVALVVVAAVNAAVVVVIDTEPTPGAKMIRSTPARRGGVFLRLPKSATPSPTRVGSKS